MARPDAVALPDYYQKPFHAYKQGALAGWLVVSYAHDWEATMPPSRVRWSVGRLVGSIQGVCRVVHDLRAHTCVYALVYKTGNLCWDAAMEVEAGM